MSCFRIRVFLGISLVLAMAAIGSARESVLDFADRVVAEDPNQSDPPTGQSLAGAFDDPLVMAVGIKGTLVDGSDADRYRMSVGAGKKIELKFEILKQLDREITALAAGPGGTAYIAAGGTIWREGVGEAEDELVLLASAGELALAAALAVDGFEIRDLAVTGDPQNTQVFAVVEGSGNLLRIDPNGRVQVAVTKEQIQETLGTNQAELGAIGIGSRSVSVIKDNPRVLLKTNMGEIEIELFPNEAPITVNNFLGYVNSRFYDGLIFHRVIDGFVIQAGGFDPNLVKKEPGAAILNESFNGVKNVRGTIAMARTSELDSATSQFFINTVDNASLDSSPPAAGNGFAVFGRVIAGMDVVDAISAVEKGPPDTPEEEIPLSPVIIESATSSEGVIELVWPVWLVERMSGSVLRSDSRFSQMTVWAGEQVISEAILEELTGSELRSGVTELPRTVLAQKTESFDVSSLVWIEQSGLYEDGFYVTRGKSFLGNGRVSHITANEAQPLDAKFDDIFVPDASQGKLNPSALAWDRDGAFGGKLYMGTNGAAFAAQQDGEVYVLNSDGSIELFVTSFVDSEGQPAMQAGEPVTGFLDVSDMAFSFSGPFGVYLYVLSENTDFDGLIFSDIWRVDPDGVAELFVGGISNSAITLAFGTFGYGNDLYVGRFASGADSSKVFRVSSDGQVSLFYDFQASGSQLSVSDIAFAPADTLLNGSLMVTLRDGTETFLAEIEPDTDGFSQVPTWGRDLRTGDAVSGDLVFDASGALVVAESTNRQLTRLDYQELFDYEIEDFQIRPFVPGGGQEGGVSDPNGTAYALLRLAGQERIVRMSRDPESASVPAIATELGPSVFKTLTEGDPQAVFTFDDLGDMYLNASGSGGLQRSSRNNQTGLFNSFSEVLSASAIESATTSEPGEAILNELVWGSDGNIIARMEDQSKPGADTIVDLGNTLSLLFQAEIRIGLSNLTQMTVEVDGPGVQERFVGQVETRLEEKLDDLTEGEYFVTIRSLGNSAGGYHLLLLREGSFEGVLSVDETNGPVEVSDLSGGRVILSVTGAGRAELQYDQRPGSGVVVDATKLVLTGSKKSTTVRLTHEGPSNGRELSLEEVILDGPLAELVCDWNVEQISAREGSKGFIKKVRMRKVQEVDALGYDFDYFRTSRMGDPNGTGNSFRANSVKRLEVDTDIHRMRFFDSTHRNHWREIRVGGVMVDSLIFGGRIDFLGVSNQGQEANAVFNSSVLLNGRPSVLKEVWIGAGDVTDSTFRVGRVIILFEIMEGNLSGSTIEVTSRTAQIGRLFVGGEVTDAPSVNGGHIRDSQITAQRIGLVHADGQITSTTIDAFGTIRSMVERIRCGGDFSGTVNASRIGEVLVGFDRSGSALPETGTFTGSDMTGTLSATSRIKTVSATGRIKEATITSLAGSITNIFAEDGIEDSTISTVSGTITRIMVGYAGGHRNQIVNPSADISGTFTARKVGRIYYTGTNSADLRRISRIGPLVDDVAE